MSLHDLVVHPLVVRTVHVVAVESVTPRMRRVRLTGEQLGAFHRAGHDHPAFASPGFDDHVKLIFAQGGPVETALPRQLSDGIEWTPAPHRAARDYTPRSFDPATGELVLDFVMHGDGPAAAWARTARSGDELSFVGPKSSLVLPPDISSIVLVGDETALPAIGRFFDERPARVPAHVLALVTDGSARQDLGEAEGDTVRWELMPQPDGDGIATAFEELAATYALGDKPFVWAAGESASLLPLRRLLAGRVARGNRSITGYWHGGKGVEEGVAAPALPEPPVTWFAIRAALQLGLLHALLEAPLGTDQLGRSLGMPARRLEPLLDALASQGLVSREPAVWTLTPLGRDLLDDDHEQEDFIGPAAEQVLSLSRLAEALRSGTPAWELSRGTSFSQTLDDPTLAEHLEHESESLVFLQHSIVRTLRDMEARDIVALGPGAQTLVDVAARAGLACVRRPDRGPAAAADVVVSAMLLRHLEDDTARAHLRGLADHAPRALLIDAPAPDALSPAAALHGLVRFATTGVPARTWDRMAELARETGWRADTARPLGWGIVAVELTPLETSASTEPRQG